MRMQTLRPAPQSLHCSSPDQEGRYARRSWTTPQGNPPGAGGQSAARGPHPVPAACAAWPAREEQSLQFKTVGKNRKRTVSWDVEGMNSSFCVRNKVVRTPPHTSVWPVVYGCFHAPRAGLSVGDLEQHRSRGADHPGSPKLAPKF